MTSSFFTSAGIFCVTCRSKKEVNSIWIQDRMLAIKLYLQLEEYASELFYCYPGQQAIKIFRRRDENNFYIESKTSNRI